MTQIIEVLIEIKFLNKCRQIGEQRSFHKNPPIHLISVLFDCTNIQSNSCAFFKYHDLLTDAKNENNIPIENFAQNALNSLRKKNLIT